MVRPVLLEGLQSPPFWIGVGQRKGWPTAEGGPGPVLEHLGEDGVRGSAWSSAAMFDPGRAAPSHHQHGRGRKSSALTPFRGAFRHTRSLGEDEAGPLGGVNGPIDP